MTTLYAGACMAVHGLWMSNDEAAQVKTELEARGTKKAKSLATEISMPSSSSYRDENAKIFASQREVMQHALDVLRSTTTDERQHIERAVEILKECLGE